jgi:hypothetical protein
VYYQVGPEETLRVTEDIVEKFKIKLQPIKDFTQVRLAAALTVCRIFAAVALCSSLCTRYGML